MSTETIRATDNPALANKLAAEATSNVEVAVPSPKVVVPLPPETTVTLPGGLLDPFDGLVTTAEIRELNGADEEAIAKLSDPGKVLLSILERATVKIGEKDATKEDLDGLLAGDREALLLAIRIATFGKDVTVAPQCPNCGEMQTFEIDLTTDVEMKTISDEDRTFTIDCKIGKVVASLPTGSTQKALINATNKNAAELDTILLKSCIESINGMPVINIQQIRDLGLKDRRELVKAITDRNPGPQLSDIKKDCKSCDKEVALPLTLADLFRE